MTRPELRWLKDDCVTPAVLGVSTFTTLRTYALIAFVIVSKVTTDHLNPEASRSFDRPINTRLPKRPALLDIIDFIWFLIIFLLFCTVVLGYEPEGSPT